MKVLIICGEQPFPANNGMRIPTWNMIKYFPATWSLSVYCINEDSSDELANSISKFRPGEVIKNSSKDKGVKKTTFKKIIKLLRFLFSMKPSFSVDHPKNFIIKDLSSIFNREFFDVVILDSEFLAIYVENLPKKSFKIISPNDSITLAWMEEINYKIFKNPIVKLYKRVNIFLSYRYEKKYYNKFDLCHFNGQVTADFVSRFVPSNKIIAISNGIDSETNSLIIPPSINSKKAIIVGALSGGNLIYTVRFIKEVWANVVARNPEMELTIVTRINPKKFSKLFQKYNIKLSNYSGDLNAYYQNFGLVITPVLKDCGIQNKVLEGMACGRPVVGYDCSFLGIPEARHFEEVLSAKNPKEFSDLLISAPAMGIKLDTIGLQARRLVSQKYAWKDKIDSLGRVIEIRANA